MLHRGDLITHFDSTTIEGREVPYGHLWQRQNVVLFVLSPVERLKASPYLRALEGRLSELKPPDTSLVISHDPIDGLPAHSLAITDRWGEIIHLQSLEPDPKRWPSVADVLEWVAFIRVTCPECPP